MNQIQQKKMIQIKNNNNILNINNSKNKDSNPIEKNESFK